MCICVLLVYLLCVCVYVDYQGFDSGAESSVLTLLLTESRLWEKREGVHSVALAGLRHHLRHHDRLGPRPLSSSRGARPGRDKGPLAEWWGAPPSGAAETHTPQVLPRLLSWNRWGVWLYICSVRIALPMVTKIAKAVGYRELNFWIMTLIEFTLVFVLAWGFRKICPYQW